MQGQQEAFVLWRFLELGDEPVVLVLDLVVPVVEASVNVGIKADDGYERSFQRPVGPGLVDGVAVGGIFGGLSFLCAKILEESCQGGLVIGLVVLLYSCFSIVVPGNGENFRGVLFVRFIELLFVVG